MISSIFQLINFGILALLMVYALRKYLVPQLREMVVKQFRYIHSLQADHAQLARDQHHLEQSIEEQEDEAMDLFKKINRWRNAVNAQHMAEKKHQEELFVLAQEKTRKQLRNYAVHHAYERTAPLVIKNLTRELSEQFADVQKGHAYITSLLKEL